MDGVWLMVFIVFFGLVGGFVVGMIVGMFCVYGLKVMNVFVQVYIELICGMLIVVQVMFLYFVLLLFVYICIDGLMVVIIVIMVNFGVYFVEVVCGVLLLILKGLMEVGFVMGLLMLCVLFKVVGLFVFWWLILLFGNQCIVSLKDMLLFIVIGVGELMCKGQEIIVGNFQVVEIWMVVVVIYLLLIGVMMLMLWFVEKWMKIL